MGKKVLSIEIGLQSTKVCELDFGKKNPKIHKALIFDTPANTIEDGYIRDKDTFAATLRLELKKAGMRRKDVVYTIASTKIANREITIPLIKEKRIQPLIDASAQDYFPVDVAEYTISYQILKKVEKGEEKGISLLLLAAPDNMIKNYYNFSEEMGFRIVAIDYVGNSSLQILKKQVGKGVSLTVQMNEQTTLINIMQGEELILQRTLLYGTISALETILEDDHFINVGDEKVKRMFWEEELLFETLDYAEEVAAALESPNDEERRKIRGRQNVTESFSYLVSNVSRVLEYFQTKYPEKVIDQILLSGQGAKIKNMERLFLNELGIETKAIHTLGNIKFPKTYMKAGLEPLDFLSPVGAVIKPIGFVSKEFSLKAERKSSFAGTQMILALSVITGVVLVVTSYMKLDLQKLENEQLQNEVKGLESIELVYEENSKVASYYENMLKIADLTENKNKELNQLLTKLEEKLPTAIRVEGIQVDGNAVVFNMISTSKIQVARLLLNLKEINMIQDAVIPSLAEKEDELGFKQYTFSLGFQYAGDVKTDEDESEGGAP